MSVYACADLHGQYWAWEKIKNILNDNDTLYFLGDAIDRGPDGWKILKEILERPNTIYLLGNHEDMMLGWNKSQWYYNGGRATEQSIREDNKNTVKEIFDKISNLPLCATYKSPSGKIIYMNHSGAHPREGYNEVDDFIWNRYHYHFESSLTDNEFIIHGHTPAIYLSDEINEPYDLKDGAFWYSDSHKCCIDCGVHFTDTTILLNLDNFEQKIITKN